ncbi:NADPH-dependent FMN reductase [Natronincola peptidivorans]|uniref:NADPH-dependent FMN reductase n=1 Tax=Natronincola peptidivorans TaxID=426128 RepID=A0A1I0DPU8_9FIRM|nr:NAD(P)H-dependent oxidoreductase [Natronincola peptidivorans]SET34391.1 NADPH-dependent FMN reductase [Natronincola peptidivorans]
MQLVIFNGSPRGKNSNSEVIIQWLIEGLQQEADNPIDLLYLNKTQNHQSYISRIQASDTALIVFPLYTDCMPGIVMAFFEALEPLRKSLSGLKLGFVVHSGFPEAHQSRFVEKYLQWLAEELDAKYMGTVIMGSSEGIRSMSSSMTKKKRKLFNQLGNSLLLENQFNVEIVKKIAGREKMSNFAAQCFSILSKTGITNYYWNSQLKKNKVYQDRFAKPYSERH